MIMKIWLRHDQMITEVSTLYRTSIMYFMLWIWPWCSHFHLPQIVSLNIDLFWSSSPITSTITNQNWKVAQCVWTWCHHAILHILKNRKLKRKVCTALDEHSQLCSDIVFINFHFSSHLCRWMSWNFGKILIFINNNKLIFIQAT